MITEKEYQTMLMASLHLPEDNRRLYYNLFEKQSVCKLFFFGGSITVGFEGNHYICPYPDLIQKNLNQMGITSTIHNYSSCSFHSHLGIALLQQALEKHVPDLLILEYAVNNGYEKEYVASFEGMIRKTLQANPLASIIILCTCDENGYSCDNYMVAIADHYHLPVILIKKVLEVGATFGFQWTDYSSDNCHPTKYGQQLIADCFGELFRQTPKSKIDSLLDTTLNPLPSQPCFGSQYETAIFEPCCKEYKIHEFQPLNKTSPFSNIVYHIFGDTQPIELEFVCQTIYLLYEQSFDLSLAEQLEIWVDSNPSCICIDGYSIFGWDCSSILPLMVHTPGTHHLRLQLKSNDPKKFFKLYGFLLL